MNELCPECAGDPRDGDGYHAYDCPLNPKAKPKPVYT